MKTIVIIDDEYYFRKALVKYISEYPKEYEVIGEAFNGTDGIHLITSLYPDIALLDISMPQENGFSVIQRVKAAGIKTKFIIISGYDRFEYAQKAIKLGVDDFLLKPITDKSLYECLKTVSEKINHEQRLEDTLSTLVKKETQNKSYLISTFMAKLSSGSFFSNELSQLSEEIEFPIENRIFLPASIYISENVRPLDKKELDIYSFAIENILKELSLKKGILCICGKDLYSILLLFSIPTQTQNPEMLIENISKKLLATASKNSKLNFIVSCDRAYTKLEDLSKAYKNILKLQNYFIFYSMWGVYFYSSYKDVLKNIFPENLIREKELALHRCIRNKNYWGIIENCQLIFDIIQEKKPAPSGTLDMLQRILNDLFHIFQKYSTAPKTALYPENISECGSLKNIKSVFTDLIKSLSQTVTDPVQPSNHLAVIRIKDYINEHYSETDIGPHSLSEIFHINEQHLCFLFKKYTNFTVGNYVLKLRMEAAKNLLETANYNVSEIAEKVGYNDAGYFSKCFKKYYGIPPKKFLS